MTKVLINPMMGWANDPHVEIIGEDYKIPDDAIYVKEDDGLYWFQDTVTGLTNFFYHNGQLQQIAKDHWRTVNNHDGYGGRVFKINVYGYGLVEVGGPWSGGSYCANKHLTKPSTEAGFYKTEKRELGRCGLGGHITIELVNKLLKTQGSGWRVIETVGPHEHNLKDYWVTCAWNGKTKKGFQSLIKEELTKEELEVLQREYCEIRGIPFKG